MPLIIEIKVVPNSGKQQLIVDKNGHLKCYLKNPPERSLANEELITFFAKTIRCPKSDVTIMAGAGARKKMIKINKALTLPELLKLFGIELQHSLLPN